jgi:hypothetical protein
MVCAGSKPFAPRGQAGFGLVGIVFSLLIVAALSIGAFTAFAGGTGSQSGPGGLNPTVDRADDVQVQSTLSAAMQNVRDAAISNGGLSGLNLAQYGVTTGSSTAPSQVSGAVAQVATSGVGDGPLGSGAVTLAAESTSGTCWYVWFSTSATWYGYEPDATTCTAQQLSSAPPPSAGSPGTIGWQQGSFPLTG